LRATQARDDSSGTVLRTRRLQLRFRDRELERQFLLSYRAAARPWIRMSLVVALSMVLGFTIIDHWLLVGPRLGIAHRGSTTRPYLWSAAVEADAVSGVGGALLKTAS